MRKIIHIFIIFVLLCIFSGMTAYGCNAERVNKKESYISKPKYTESKEELKQEEASFRTSFLLVKMVVAIVKEYKKPVILPEFKNVDLEPDFRVQYPRRNTTEDVETNICSI